MEIVAVFLFLSACCGVAAVFVSHAARVLAPCWYFFGPCMMAIIEAVVDWARSWMDPLCPTTTVSAMESADNAEADNDDDDDPAYAKPQWTRRCTTVPKESEATVDSRPEKHAWASPGWGAFCRVATVDADDGDDDWDVEPNGMCPSVSSAAADTPPTSNGLAIVMDDDDADDMHSERGSNATAHDQLTVVGNGRDGRDRRASARTSTTPGAMRFGGGRTSTMALVPVDEPSDDEEPRHGSPPNGQWPARRRLQAAEQPRTSSGSACTFGGRRSSRRR